MNALNEKKVSILPKGIISVNGNFLSDSIINVISEDGKLIAKGISNYSSDQIDLIKGKKSNEFLGKKYLKEEVIHANNLVIIREDILC